MTRHVRGGAWRTTFGTCCTEVVCRDFNGGVSCKMVHGSTTLNGDPVLAMAVAPTDPNIVFATTAPLLRVAGFFRTLDGGTSFQNVTGPLPNRYLVGLAVDPTAPQTVYVTAGGFGTGHLFRSRDAGNSWEDITNGLPDVPTLSVIVDPERPDHIYVGNDLGVFFSRDDGATWHDFSDGLGDAVMAMDLNVTADDKVMVSTYGNGVYTRSLERAPVSVDVTPRAARLEQNVPNPFNPITTVWFTVAEAGPVELTVVDVRGARVRTLVRRDVGAGRHSAVWDGRDDAGRTVGGGAYVAMLKSGGSVSSVTMQLLK